MQTLFWGSTFLNEQVCVELIVIEPPWDLDPAAVGASIAPLSIQDGQGRVSSRLPPQLVLGGLPELYSAILWGEDGVGAFESGHRTSSPAEAQNSPSLGVVLTEQGDVVPNETGDADGAGALCEGQSLIRHDNTELLWNLKAVTGRTEASSHKQGANTNKEDST